MEGITTSDGAPLFEEAINPVFGYQIIHKHSGRVFPTCQRFNIYGYHAAQQKMRDVFDTGLLTEDQINEYELEPIYQSEIDEMEGYNIVMSEKDFTDPL